MIPMCEDQEPDGASTCPGNAPGPRLSQWPLRCAVAADRLLPARTGARRAGAAAGALAPPGRERDLVRGPDRLPVALPARRLAALARRVRLLRPLARRRRPGPAAQPVTRRRPRRRRAQHPSDRRHHRPPSRCAPPTPCPGPPGAGIPPRRSTAANDTSPSMSPGWAWTCWSPPRP
jgi:hypothetical protein